mgnify:FL=1
MLIIICIMLYICSVLHAEIILKMYKMIFLKRNRFSHRTVSNVLWLPSVRKNWVLFVYWEKYIKRSAVFRLFMITRFSIVFFKNDRVFSCNYNGCNDYNGYNTWVLKVGHYCRCLQHQILLNYWCQCRHRQWYGKRRWSSSSSSVLPLLLLPFLLLPFLLLLSVDHDHKGLIPSTTIHNALVLCMCETERERERERERECLYIKWAAK